MREEVEPLTTIVCEIPKPPTTEAEAAPTYTYVSPAPPAEAAPVVKLRTQLLDRSRPLFERYRALFALRDAAAKQEAHSSDDLPPISDGLGAELAPDMPAEVPPHVSAVAALCACLNRATNESALLKHEVTDMHVCNHHARVCNHQRPIAHM